MTTGNVNFEADSVICSARSVESQCKGEASILGRADGGKWTAEQYILYIQHKPSRLGGTIDEARNLVIRAVLVEVTNGRVVELEDGINMHITARQGAELQVIGENKWR